MVIQANVQVPLQQQHVWSKKTTNSNMKRLKLARKIVQFEPISTTPKESFKNSTERGHLRHEKKDRKQNPLLTVNGSSPSSSFR
jgi:phosphopantothenoylcysteine synthetase/decarboxylase